LKRSSDLSALRTVQHVICSVLLYITKGAGRERNFSYSMEAVFAWENFLEEFEQDRLEKSTFGLDSSNLDDKSIGRDSVN
jgi:hypothetical protein